MNHTFQAKKDKNAIRVTNPEALSTSAREAVPVLNKERTVHEAPTHDTQSNGLALKSNVNYRRKRTSWCVRPFTTLIPVRLFLQVLTVM